MPLVCVTCKPCTFPDTKVSTSASTKSSFVVYWAEAPRLMCFLRFLLRRWLEIACCEIHYDFISRSFQLLQCSGIADFSHYQGWGAVCNRKRRYEGCLLSTIVCFRASRLKRQRIQSLCIVYMYVCKHSLLFMCKASLKVRAFLWVYVQQRIKALDIEASSKGKGNNRILSFLLL